MILGIHTELFEDQGNRIILRIKTTDEHYLVNPKEERLVRRLQTNLMNAVTISLILGMFFKWRPEIYVIVASAIYGGYFFYFNTKIFSKLQKLHEKSIKRKNIKTRGVGQLIIQAAAFLLVGFGLAYCILTGQVAEGIMRLAAITGTGIAFLFGIKFLFSL